MRTPGGPKGRKAEKWNADLARFEQACQNTRRFVVEEKRGGVVRRRAYYARREARPRKRAQKKHLGTRQTSFLETTKRKRRKDARSK